MELPSAGPPLVRIRTRPRRLNPTAARRPATPLPMTRKSTTDVVQPGCARGAMIRLPGGRLVDGKPPGRHAKRIVAVDATHGEILVAHQAKNRMASLANRLIICLPLPLPLPVEIHRHVRAFD